MAQGDSDTGPDPKDAPSRVRSLFTDSFSSYMCRPALLSWWTLGL